MGSFFASISKLGKHLSLKRSGRNDHSAESPAEGAAAAAESPRSAAKDSSPRHCLSLQASRRPDNQSSYRYHVASEVTPPAKSKKGKETARSRPPVLPHEAIEPVPHLGPSPSTAASACHEAEPSWALFLAGQKTAGEDASSYYPPWYDLPPAVRFYFGCRGVRRIAGSETVPTKCGQTMVVMKRNPFPRYAVPWREVDWKGSSDDGCGIQVDNDDQIEDEDGQAEDGGQVEGEQWVVRHQPSLAPTRRADFESKRSKGNGTDENARSMFHSRSSPSIRSALHRFSPWNRKRPAEKRAGPSHRTSAPSAPILRNRDDNIAIHRGERSNAPERRAAVSNGEQMAGPKSECWWVL